jgi:hypothetical protein
MHIGETSILLAGAQTRDITIRWKNVTLLSSVNDLIQIAEKSKF